jgi:hypothetical protein
MANLAEKAERIFKTAWFSKSSRKAHIPDSELCAAIQQVMLGSATIWAAESSRSG